MKKQQESSREELAVVENAEEKEIHEKVESKALWESIKAFRKKFSRTQVIPEEYQLPEHVAPLKRCKPDISVGLTEEQVQERISYGAVNAPVESPSKSTKEIVYSNVFTYFNLIFFIIAVLLCLVGSFRDLSFLPIVLANTFIGIIQELRAKKVLDDLSILNAPKSSVIRDGQEKTIPAEDLVVDDVIVFRAGNQIPADAVVEEGEVLVNESLITGEADQISKKQGSTLLSGSFIVSGECRARVEQVGKDSYVSSLTLEAKAMNDEELSEMIRSLDRLVKMVGIVIIPIGIVLFSQQYFIGGSSIRDSVTATVAAVIGMIPEGLYLLASVALVVSVMRLAMQKVLVHNMKCIETLARVDVLCVDKTGTVTDNTMTVKKFLPLRKKDGGEEGQEQSAEEAFTAEEQNEAELAVGDFAAAMATDNITMKAVKEYFRKRSGKRPNQIFPFTSENKYSGAAFDEGQYVLGAPEFILRGQYQEYAPSIENWSRQGYRVLVFARYMGTLEGKPLTEPVEPIGMVLLANPVRANAKETFHYFAQQGVEIKVISGDNPVTVSQVAAEAGIAGAEKYVDASVFADQEELERAASSYTVFGRVKPEQKRQLISALKKAGHTVAMTGDGVNDILALKDADCSIAMASGSDAAAQAAQIVLLESDFSKMPSVVAEGRRVVNNIERTASLFLVKNIFSLFLSIFSIILMVNYPLEPSQISLISMFTIGIPAFFMSLERNTDRIQGHFLSNVLFKALPGGLTDFLTVSALYLFCMEFNVSENDVSTSCTILLAIVGLMILYQIASPMTKAHWLLWIAMAAGLVYCMIFVSSIFAISSISKKCLMLLVMFAIITEPTFRYLSLWIKKLSKLYRSHRRKQKEAA
ncbi:MAG TPA: cation-translocating P-type ATPase [Candidatus Choladousia intestinigallinarum]|nr:cation-translocating P-type ATPase [Candidatus Choladousia intestinigallinarum]